ncbi:hypothetical protein Tco_0520163 [Tanacetum coccineum]
MVQNKYHDAWYDMLQVSHFTTFLKVAVDQLSHTESRKRLITDVDDGVDVILFRIQNFSKSHGSVDKPMVEKNKLDEDLHETLVNATLYRGMIGSFMYLTSSRPDLIYAVCLCARYQAKPTKKHLNAVKRIFRYLKGTINMGLCRISTDGHLQPKRLVERERFKLLDRITQYESKSSGNAF